MIEVSDDLPVGFRIERVDDRSDPILRNLFELYLHDLAEWFEFDTNENGSYAFPTDQVVWQQGLEVDIAFVDRIPMGFALVGSADRWVDDPRCHDVDEFFVVRRYRRSGVGRAMAKWLWDAHPGPWLVRVYQRNLPALPFWRAAVGAYSDGAFTEDTRAVDGKLWSYFRFDAPACRNG